MNIKLNKIVRDKIDKSRKWTQCEIKTINNTYTIEVNGYWIVLTSKHNLKALQDFLDLNKKKNKNGRLYEHIITEFASDVLKADDLMQETREI
mgnify:CR=1 FL=1